MIVTAEFLRRAGGGARRCTAHGERAPFPARAPYRSAGHGSTGDSAEIWKQAAPLRELGWVDGQSLQVARHYANGRLEALQSLAKELVHAKVELIVAIGPNPTLAAKRAVIR
jgi:hypothetical protein